MPIQKNQAKVFKWSRSLTSAAVLIIKPIVTFVAEPENLFGQIYFCIFQIQWQKKLELIVQCFFRLQNVTRIIYCKKPQL